MTSQILSNELTNLISESKRKNTDLRNAADKSLQDLKALPSTSEQQLAADLARRPNFVNPFLLACSTRNSRLAGIGVSCLQRLVASHGLPKDRLEEVLEAFKESAQLGLDVQLKILQALPPLLQGYADELQGELLASALQVCSILQTVKSAAVSNTAAATLQQLFTAVYEKVAEEDATDPDGPYVDEVATEDGPIAVRTASKDAYKVFDDLCLLAEGQKPQFVLFAALPQPSCLEIIEAILTTHSRIFGIHEEQKAILRLRIIPLITRCLSEKVGFTVSLRIFRILSVVLRKFVSELPTDCEIPLGLLNHMLDGDVVPAWKRNLCMEIFRSIYADPRLFLELYAQYDSVEDRKPILKDNFAAFVRLATEKPAKIGLGQQSTAPVGQAGTGGEISIDHAAVEAGVAGIIGTGGLGVAEVNVPGISVQLSSLKTPCLDQLDKTEAPIVPETYVYSLVLTCLNSVADGLAKCVLPLSIHQVSKERRRRKPKGTGDAEESPMSPDPDSRSIESSTRPILTRSMSYRKRSVPLNPLELTASSSYAMVKVAASLINECWPAVLATCSTFLYAALDAEYYHALVRSIQKFTQAAGVLRLSTPRDAFLTTLGKAAVPPNLTSAIVSAAGAPNGEAPRVYTNAKGLLSVDSLVSQASTLSVEKSRRQSVSIEADAPHLTTRNLLCLRALINLAIALGPTLESAWSIVLETLQSADIVLAAFSNKSTPGDYRASPQLGGRNEVDSASASNLNTEIKAVQAAASRMFDNTSDYPDDAFVQVLKATFNVFFGKHITSPPTSPIAEESQHPIPIPPRRIGSISSLPTAVNVQSQEYTLALTKIREVSRANHLRLAAHEPEVSGWDFLTSELIKISTSATAVHAVRTLAADILRERLFATADATRKEDSMTRREIQRRVLSTLQSELDILVEDDRRMKENDHYIHESILETLKDVLDVCGESLLDGWDSVFKIITSVFERLDDSHTNGSNSDSSARHPTSVRLISGKLGRIAFSSVQVVYSECRLVLPARFLSVLNDTLLLFALQLNDLNMSLTTISIFQDVSEFLQKQVVLSELETLHGAVSAEDMSPGIVIKESAQVRVSAVWLSLLRHLTSIANDERSEVRNTAVRTILTIFDHYGELPSAPAWSLLITSVLFKLVDTNIEAQRRAQSKGVSDEEDSQSWDGSSKIILDGIAIIFSTFLETISRTTDFSSLWQTLMAYLEFYLSFRSHSLNASVFRTLSTIMSRAPEASLLGKPALNRVGSIWANKIPEGSSSDNAEGKQEAFLAYTSTLRELYRLTKKDMTSGQIDTITDNLEQCIRESDALSYSADVDYLTPLQAEVLDIVQQLRTDITGASSTILELKGTLASMAFDEDKDEIYKTSLTFVALAKTAMPSLAKFVEQQSDEKEIYTGDALTSVLDSLARPIELKYGWRKEGSKPPPPWQLATSTALDILQIAVPKAKLLSTDEGMQEILMRATRIARGIAQADLSFVSSRKKVQQDVEFDIESFTALHNLLIPYLNSPTVPDSIQASYALLLFNNSIVHAPEPEEIPSTASPLDIIYNIRFGRTSDPPPSPRRKMSYLCLNFLLDLVRSPTTTPNPNPTHEAIVSSTPTNGPLLPPEEQTRTRLAQAAGSHLLYRAALPLKAYIADQPLRGRMPQPESQRQELLFVLRAMRTLASEPAAFPETVAGGDGGATTGRDHRRGGGGGVAATKKHLVALYPLVVKALGVAGRVPGGADEEVLEELGAFLDKAGLGLGVGMGG
ncbi:MAG: hypothetical protein M1821_007630 [Bathelium mastoideum]|nr:MAG: hypothetical protein M1821_007630 [Bathelium mastoideum]